MNRKRFCVLLALVFMLSVVPMARAASTETPDLLARIQAKGEMIIATEGTWAPWTYHDKSETLVGFDVEVATLVAAKLGVTATFIECEWDSIFAGLDSQRYDVVANGVEFTDERAEKFDFTIPYAYIRTALIVRGDNNTITCFEDLDGKRTANTLSSTYATLAESYGAETVGVDSLDQTIQLVLTGRVDATLNAELSFYDYIGVHPESDLKIVDLTEEASLVCMPVRKGDDTASFLAAVNAAIAELAEEGELARVSVKYFGNDITAAEAE